MRQSFKVAIILPPPWSPLIPPLGIVTVAEIFRKNGIDCFEFDWNIELLHSFEKKFGKDFHRNHPLYWDAVYSSNFWQEALFSENYFGKLVRDWFENEISVLIQKGFNVFGFSVFDTNKNVTKYLVTNFKKQFSDCLIIAGGPGMNVYVEYSHAENWLKHINLIFYKEVEDTLLLFINALKSSGNFDEIKGTAYIKKTNLFSFGFMKAVARKILFNKPIEYFSLKYLPQNHPPDLEKIPPLNLDHLDLKKYKTGGIPIEFSRGCKGSCSFCSETVRYKPYRIRPVLEIINDIKTAKEKYKANYICLICSALNGDPKHLKDFCQALINEKVNIHWGGNARPDLTLTPELLELMAEAGCRDLDFGVESGSDHVLSLMNKRFDISTASKIIRKCHQSGIKTSVNLIVGFPGENEDDFRLTLSFIKEHFSLVEMFNVSKCYVDGQAPLGKRPEKFNIQTQNKKILAFRDEETEDDKLPAIIKNGPSWSHWATIDAHNTPYIREKRYQQVLKLLDDLGKRGNTPHDSIHSADLL
ncbi:MAG TPA: radical SAM protein [Bacteroidia bacterium]|nr:radical SAM protein [Bacteroidia bacterium]HRS58669.1 radical SAM protein [Bacteroidia bacterium]HRU69344.1 radical SAM protein [Bacteroidia bacterium]